MYLSKILRRAGLVGFCCGALVISIPSLVSKSSAEAPRRTVSSGDPIIPQQPMGAPLLGLTEEQLERFFVGREQFDRVFTVVEGLGTKLGCVIGRCKNHRWEQICEDSLTGGCGPKPDFPPVGCRIGECADGIWQLLCVEPIPVPLYD